MASKARTEAACLNSALADLAGTSAALATTNALLGLIERHERRRAEAFARIEAMDARGAGK